MKGDAGSAIDVGKANDHWFINAASSGFGAEITATTSPETQTPAWSCRLHRDGCSPGYQPSSLSGKAYACPTAKLLAAARWQSSGMDARRAAVHPSRSTRQGSTTVCSMCLRHSSGLADGAAWRPRARIATAPSRWRVYLYWQTPWLEVHPEETIPVNLDGEPLRFSSVRYEAVPKVISADCSTRTGGMLSRNDPTRRPNARH